MELNTKNVCICLDLVLLRFNLVLQLKQLLK